ncbi:GntR family transcriptional regulator [Geodermatophilus ruber]|uniref:Transcriptional regulator, GntR family n=1 Tax=Geodermatophilus ruber TaxID=504800 RepID=A0A1I3Z179_9ACTN|nr:GntR family transcriptional regulator [Geodermatophilus ruber]SFK37858.1 transcriptional regulator, GntR family [Geodermatophilus ruber]
MAAAPTFEIDRSSPTPLYFQLAQAIEGAIAGGQLPSGSRLENEILLAQRHGLSRPTVRRAVQELVDKGLLVRKRGVGTQVIQPHVRRSVELTSLYDDLARAGEAPTTEVLSLERRPAPADVAGELDLAEGAEIVVLRRLRRSHGEPLALMTNHLPGRFAPTVEELSERGLYQYLRGQGVHLRVAHQRIGARLARTEEARLLDEPPRAALLTMQRTAFDDKGAAIEFGQHLYRASRYDFETTLVGR